MSYSETRIVIGGIAHVAIIIFITNLIKGKFGIKTQEAEDTVIKEELGKIIELKDTVIREEKAYDIQEFSNKLDNIQQKADDVYEKVKKKKKIKIRRNKRITKLRLYQASIHLERELYLSYLHLRDLYKIQSQLEFFSCKLP
tara:strand:- start:176 stop:601 length:426 start_codon:yes stop_codon:yes gene_type:complete